MKLSPQAAEQRAPEGNDATLDAYKPTLRELIKPRRLKKGDTIGIIAPSTPPFEQGTLVQVFKQLESLGLKCKLGKHIFHTYSDMAGVDEERLADFHELWEDDEVKAIVPLCGGNGSVRLLPGLDFDLIAKKPKIIIGYSDITGLILPIHQQTKLVTFHGPTLGSFFESEYTHRGMIHALMHSEPLGVITDPPVKSKWHPTYPPPRLVIAKGAAKGRLIGGCMTLIRQLMGTPFEMNTEGKIVFLEDVEEEPHSIDRMLSQLLLAGKLQKAAGIIIGDCVRCRPGDSKRNSFNLNFSLETVLRERLGGLGIPVVFGMRFGHGLNKITLPLGVMASLSVSQRGVKFKIEESATAA